MAIGITEVNIEYINYNDRCIARVTGSYTVDVAGTYAIAGCSFGADYICVEWGERFTVVEGDLQTMPFERVGLDMTDGADGNEYDFYYHPGYEIDISLFTSPFEVNSTIVGLQQSVVMEGCDQTQTCVPGHTKCIENSVYKCIIDGTRYDYTVTCGEGYYCENGTCVPDGNGGDPDDPILDDHTLNILYGIAAATAAVIVIKKVL